MTSSKVCIVTGANKGIGFATVKELCKKFDGIVYLTARDVQRGRAAVQELEKEGLFPKFHQLDIDNKESISNLADYIKANHGGLDVLVNNASIAYKGTGKEPFGEQAEDTIRVNYFGIRNICKAIFPLLNSHARVVNVSSCVGHLRNVNGDEPKATELRAKLASDSLTEEELDTIVQDFIKHAKAGDWKAHGWLRSSYGASKIGVSALTRIHQRQFDKDNRTDLVINNCHPGYVDTDMTSHKGYLTLEEGARCPVYLALLPPNEKKIKGSFLWYDTQVVDWINGPTPSLYSSPQEPII